MVSNVLGRCGNTAVCSVEGDEMNINKELDKLRKEEGIPIEDVLIVVHTTKDKLKALEGALELVGITKMIELVPEKEEVE